MEFKKSTKLTELREGMPGVHWEIAMASTEDNINYCTKAESRVLGPFWFNKDGLVLLMFYESLRLVLYGKPWDMINALWHRLQATYVLGTSMESSATVPIGTQPFPGDGPSNFRHPQKVPFRTVPRVEPTLIDLTNDSRGEKRMAEDYEAYCEEDVDDVLQMESQRQDDYPEEEDLDSQLPYDAYYSEDEEW